jgi:hypothetical protein
VLKSLELSYETLFAEARALNALNKEHHPGEQLLDLEERINAIRSGRVSSIVKR